MIQARQIAVSTTPVRLTTGEYPAEIIRQDQHAHVYIGGKDVDTGGNGVLLQHGRIGEVVWSYTPRPRQRDQLYAVVDPADEGEGGDTAVVGVVEYARSPWR